MWPFCNPCLAIQPHTAYCSWSVFTGDQEKQAARLEEVHAAALRQQDSQRRGGDGTAPSGERQDAADEEDVGPPRPPAGNDAADDEADIGPPRQA